MWGWWMVVGCWVGKGSHLDIRLASKGFDVVHFHTSLVELLQRGRESHTHASNNKHHGTFNHLYFGIMKLICVLVLLTP